MEEIGYVRLVELASDKMHTKASTFLCCETINTSRGTSRHIAIDHISFDFPSHFYQDPQLAAAYMHLTQPYKNRNTCYRR